MQMIFPVRSTVSGCAAAEVLLPEVSFAVFAEELLLPAGFSDDGAAEAADVLPGEADGEPEVCESGLAAGAVA